MPRQMTSAEAASAAKAAGLAYVEIPFAGGPGPAQVEATMEALETAAQPVLAFCRSGTRSITAWALAQAAAGAMAPDQILQAAGRAGYDLSPYARVFAELAAED